MEAGRNDHPTTPLFAQEMPAPVDREELDHALDLLAEERRPKGPNGIPAPFIRAQLDMKGRGNLEAYIAALKAAVH